jgi:branched-chain amino acid transport system substrate-binding protein
VTVALRTFGIALVALLVAAACAAPVAAPTGSPTAATAQATAAPTAAVPYEINTILSLTGSAAFLGTSEQQSLNVLEGVVNKQGGIAGRPVKFVYFDDQSNPAIDAQLGSQIIAKNVPVILGPSILAMCNAVAPLAAKGPLLYCLSPVIHPADGSFIYASSFSGIDFDRALFKYLKAKGLTKIATLNPTDATGQEADAAIATAVAEVPGLSVVAKESYNPTDVSVSAQITRIKASGAQILMAWAAGTPIATAFRGVAQGGLDIPVATNSGNMTYAQMAQYKDFLPKELLIPSPQWPAVDATPAGPVKDALTTYNNAMTAAGVKPDAGHALAWDPALIVIEALKKVGPNATAEQLRATIAGFKGFAGVNGLYDFTKTQQRGLTADQAIVTRWDAAKNTWVPVSGQ